MSRSKKEIELNNLFVNGPRDANGTLITESVEKAIVRMEQMLFEGININVREDCFGWSVLISCIHSSIPIQDTLTIMEWLLTRNPPININLKSMGGTAIAWAIGQRKPEIVRLLLNYGADISTLDIPTTKGFKSLIYHSLAQRETLPEIKEMLRQHRLNPPSQEQICQRADAFRVARGEVARGLIILSDFIPYTEIGHWIEPEIYNIE
jgi:hypothetical protein